MKLRTIIFHSFGGWKRLAFDNSAVDLHHIPTAFAIPAKEYINSAGTLLQITEPDSDNGSGRNSLHLQRYFQVSAD
jgi:hypothetical protein